MKYLLIGETRARLRTWLALGYVLLIVYASLSPFTDWQEQGLQFLQVMSQPLRRTYTAFDAVVNVLSYLPLGFLLGITLRARLGIFLSTLGSLILCIALSAGMEYLQMYLPSRVSSNMDLISNSLGGLIGTLLAVRLTLWPSLFFQLLRWRSRTFQMGKEMDYGLALLVLWMFGQMNPSLPMLGNMFITEVARQPFVVVTPSPFNWWEASGVSMNLLMLGALLITLLRKQRDVIIAILCVLCLVALSKFFIASALLKSWAVLLWVNSEAIWGIVIGCALLLAGVWIPRHVIIGMSAILAMLYFIMVNASFDSDAPQEAMSIYHWHYRHLLNYNGLAQTIILLFPISLLFHLWRMHKFYKGKKP